MKDFIDKLPSWLKNKFVIVILIFAVWVSFFDQNNLIQRYKYMRHHKQLLHDRAYYNNRIQQDAHRLNELEQDKDKLEKFAREEYYMKKDNEDIFIIVESED